MSGFFMGTSGRHLHCWAAKRWLWGICILWLCFVIRRAARLTRQVWMRADIDSEALARILLKKSKIKIVGSVEETLQKHFNIKAEGIGALYYAQLQRFLRRQTHKRNPTQKRNRCEALIGPVLRSEAVDVDESELYLLDGTYLGTLNQLRAL